MTIRKNPAALLVIAALIVISFFSARAAHANPSAFAPTKETASATTTLVFMAPGAATTTLTYDSLSGDSVKIDSLTVAFQATASSTGPTLNVRLEDSPNGIDWYPRTVGAGILATTTLMTTPFNTLSFVLSTTTDNGGSGTSSRIHESFTVTAPMRWVRVVFSQPVGTTNLGLWAQMIPVKETPER